MCRFFYDECRSCTSRSPCRYYSDSFEYCRSHKNAYSWHDEKLKPTLMVMEADRYGILDDWDNEVHFRTEPKNRRYLFDMIGCAEPYPVKTNSRKEVECPYHKPGGLKERWDMIKRQRNNGAGKLERERRRKREAQERKIAAEKQKKADKEAREFRKERDREGCCVVQ